MSLNRPNPFLSKWAENGKRFDVPDTGADHANGRADIQSGFPDTTMKSVLQGGTPPWGQDHNGILHKITQSIQWTQAGGWPVYDEAFAQRNGGYSKGAIVQQSAGDNIWVAWINLEDGNMVNPAGLDIGKPGAQGGWRRYPVIEETEGATLIYNDRGELKVFTATNTSEKYVSWDAGSDQTGDGTRARPYKTIDKAIRSSPSSGNINIYLRDYDTHYFINFDNALIANQDGVNGHLDKLPGALLTQNDNVTEYPGALLPANTFAGTRNITFLPYTDKYDIDPWSRITTEFFNKIGDTGYTYCLSDQEYQTLGIGRPKVVLLWNYAYNEVDGKFVTKGAAWSGLYGTVNSFSYNFYGIAFSVYKVDQLKAFEYGIVSGFFQNGGGYQFLGCRFDDLNIGNDRTIFGGYTDALTSYTFSKVNYFSGDLAVKGSPIVNNINNLTIYINSETYDWVQTTTGYTLLSNNALAFFQRASIYSGQALATISTPSKRYAYLNPSFEIKSGL
ncbi:hypothetical protein [Commensalibacter oyaizuii]|uniref:Tail fiber protein n=1 Tax=Commensalibacter oyaizuii TaxID=3043873 RepID=A0ABT6Q2W1_9PROT|nr:hypothetical protein [Commensalibacter sp. TBRC 16381]MDI2091462.1 hypothetical protein [Commensalibacter sp. TBRC 16381]